MSCRPELTTWVATGPNGEPINVRKCGGTKPYYDFEFGGESVQSRSVEDGIAIISKRAQYARLLTEMCASYGLVPDASRNAGRAPSLRRDLAFDDLVLTITRNNNSFYDGWITNANGPRKTIWSVHEATLDGLFERAKVALTTEVVSHIRITTRNLIELCKKVDMSVDDLELITPRVRTQIQKETSSEGKEG